MYGVCKYVYRGKASLIGHIISSSRSQILCTSSFPRCTGEQWLCLLLAHLLCTSSCLAIVARRAKSNALLLCHLVCCAREDRQVFVVAHPSFLILLSPSSSFFCFWPRQTDRKYSWKLGKPCYVREKGCGSRDLTARR